MDAQTLQVYQENALAFCAEYRAQRPQALHRVVRGFFLPGRPTVDIGSGSGRDVHWLNEEGFPAVGIEPASEMRQQARSAYPNLEFEDSSLPDLATIPSETFTNALCSGVLMHVPREDLITVVLSLARILVPGGRLVLSMRASRASDEREADGRLFTTIHPGRMTLLLESAGFQVRASETQPDEMRCEIVWHTILATKSPALAARGLDRLQAILAQDAKFATYKLALIRALCHISRAEKELVVQLGAGSVYVPLWAIAAHWLEYYWPLITSTEFIAQRRGERMGSAKPLKFRTTIQELAGKVGRDGLWAVRRAMDERPEEYFQPLKVIAETIRSGPVTHAGTWTAPVFGFAKSSALPGSSGLLGSLGWVEVPEAVWLDISRFDHWIEDSVLVRWAKLTAEMNPGSTAADYFPLLLPRIGDERDTLEVRQLLSSWTGSLECVWSGRAIGRGALHVDHAIPYAVWGNNDLWNLLPCLNSVNSDKSDALPSPGLLQARRDAIFAYWEFYWKAFGRRFEFQAGRALGTQVGMNGWQDLALTSLRETVQELSMGRGLRQWQPVTIVTTTLDPQ